MAIPAACVVHSTEVNSVILSRTLIIAHRDTLVLILLDIFVERAVKFGREVGTR